MKLLLVAFACIALAAAEVKWSEDGQYRLVDTEPFRYISYGAAVPEAYSTALPYRFTYPTVPMPYRMLALREHEPFFYSYQQISRD